MPPVLWDASALIKHYYVEAGSPSADAIFQSVPARQMVTTLWGYAECFAILNRKRNSGAISTATFTRSSTKMEQEVLNSPDFRLLSIEDDRVLAGLGLVTRHGLNSADAAILATYLRYARSLPAGSPACIFTASDWRFLRAASAEGLATLNPETLAAGDIPRLLPR